MKNWALSYIRCPKCISPLESHFFEAKGEELWSGLMICLNPGCQRWYPIVRGVPRMLPEGLRIELTKQFMREHHAPLSKLGLINTANADHNDDLHELKQRTIQNFGFEWLEYARFGWDDPVYNIQREEKVFRYKSLLEPKDISGKLVLDAGCGNGR